MAHNTASDSNSVSEKVKQGHPKPYQTFYKKDESLLLANFKTVADDKSNAG